MGAQSNWASEQLALLETGWDRLMRAIKRLGPGGLDRRIGTGWTVKEMLAHLAFWEETSLPVTEQMHRNGPEIPPKRWYGGTDLEIAPGDPWPNADTHNAREARWARARTDAEVLDRLLRARQQLKSVVATVTDEEGRGKIGRHLSGLCRHTDEHLAKLEAIANP